MNQAGYFMSGRVSYIRMNHLAEMRKGRKNKQQINRKLNDKEHRKANIASIYLVLEEIKYTYQND